MFGDSILYLITFDIELKNVKIAKILRLQEMEGLVLSEEHINGIQERFKQHIEHLSNEDLAVEKEKLCYLIQNEEQRISSSVDKINIYASIILTVFPLVLAVIDLKRIITLPFLLVLGIFFMVYSLVNICAYVFKAIKVQGIRKSTFSDLRASQKKDKEILVQYQYDWQQLKTKAQLFVSYVLNLQEWIILVLSLAVIVSMGIAIKGTCANGLSINGIKNSEVITLNIYNVDEPYNQDAIKWKELLLDTEKESYKRIVFIGNCDEMPTFFNELDKYDDLEIDFLQDSQMDKEQIKIILEER